jgi:hypothetical protein
VWTATTSAHVATTTAVAIIVKSGIAVDFAGFAISHPLISDEGESYSPKMCRIFEKHRHDANRLSPARADTGKQVTPWPMQGLFIWRIASVRSRFLLE